MSKCGQKDIGTTFLQVSKSEKPSFHVAFELLFLHGVLQLFVRPDVASEFLHVTDFYFQSNTSHFKAVLVQCLQVVSNSLQTIILFRVAL